VHKKSYKLNKFWLKWLNSRIFKAEGLIPNFTWGTKNIFNPYFKYTYYVSFSEFSSSFFVLAHSFFSSCAFILLLRNTFFALFSLWTTCTVVAPLSLLCWLCAYNSSPCIVAFLLLCSCWALARALAALVALVDALALVVVVDVVHANIMAVVFLLTPSQLSRSCSVFSI